MVVSGEFGRTEMDAEVVEKAAVVQNGGDTRENKMRGGAFNLWSPWGMK